MQIQPRRRPQFVSDFASAKPPLQPQPVPQLQSPPAAKPSLASLALSAAAEAPQPVASSTLARQVPIDMNLPGDESPSRLDTSVNAVKWQGFRRKASRGMAVAMILAITMGGLLFSQSYLKIHKVFKGGTETAAALQNNVKPELLKGEGRGRINILLMGRGGGTHDAPDLTDTLMLASIDPINHQTTLISLPRDLWVNVPDHGVMKLNAAWETGEFKYLGRGTTGSTDPKAIAAGFQVVDQTIEEVLGITIDYNMLLNFQAFKQAIDTVNGVNVNVPSDLVDPTMAWENSHNPVLAKAGPQHFDGKQSLIYVRSRETSSDFARAERQRSVLLALKGKVATIGTLSNPMKLSGLMNAFGDNIQTDLSIKDATRLYSITRNIDDSNIASIGLADPPTPFVGGGNINGQSVVLPKAGLFKYDEIQQFVRSKLKDPYIMREAAKIMVLNGTALPGMASAKADELKSYGYNVVSIGNTPSSGWTQTTLVDLTHKNKYTKNYLEKRMSRTAASSLSDTTIPTNGADFAIIIGSDEATPTHP